MYRFDGQPTFSSPPPRMVMLERLTDRHITLAYTLLAVHRLVYDADEVDPHTDGRPQQSWRKLRASRGVTRARAPRLDERERMQVARAWRVAFDSSQLGRRLAGGQRVRSGRAVRADALRLV